MDILVATQETEPDQAVDAQRRDSPTDPDLEAVNRQAIEFHVPQAAARVATRLGETFLPQLVDRALTDAR